MQVRSQTIKLMFFFFLACEQVQASVHSTAKEERMKDKKMHVKGFASKTHPCSLSFAVYCQSESGTHLLSRGKIELQIEFSLIGPSPLS